MVACSICRRAGTVWRDLIARNEPIDPPEILGLGRLPRTVILRGNEQDHFEWRKISLDTGQGEIIASADNQSAIHDPVTGRLIGLHAMVGDEDRYTLFDAQDDRVWKAVVAAFPGDRVDLISRSNDRRRILVRLDSATLGPAYAVVDLATRNASWLGAEYQALKAVDTRRTLAIGDPPRPITGGWRRVGFSAIGRCAQLSSDFSGGFGGMGATGTPSSTRSRTSLGEAWP